MDLGDLFNKLLLFGDDGLFGPGPHDGILRAHSAVERALEFGTKCELAKVIRLFLVEDDALHSQGLILHAIESGGDVAEFGLC